MSYHVNEQFFLSWNESSAYVLGFWLANGSIYRDQVIFNTEDLEQLTLIKNLMESNHPFYYGRQLRISNVNLARDLRRVVSVETGVSRRDAMKAGTVELPRLERSLMHHLIRGYFDGNGRFYLEGTRRVITSFTCASEAFLEEIRDELLHAGCANSNIHRRDNPFGTTYELKYYKKDTDKIYEWIYDEATCFRRTHRDRYIEGKKALGEEEDIA
ncbi:MAG: hypothetical protein NWF07_13735 [Candidatus Bathyarchaeota archaeon]|nr:hypothetical protein [Candidatus Bathyarchaeota archaeon]